VRLQERLKRRFRGLPNSPVPAPANGKPTERILEGNVGASDDDAECDKDVDRPRVSYVSPFLHYCLTVVQNNDKGKDRQVTPPDDLPAAHDNDDNRMLWKSLMRAPGKHTSSGKTPAKVTCDSSSKVVEVYAARGFQVIFSFISFTLLFLLVTKTTEIRRIQAKT